MADSSSQPISLADVDVQEILPGFAARFVHSESMTFAYWTIQDSAELPLHSHHHEQVVNLLEGEFELTLSGVPHHLRTGDVLIIPRNAPHSGRAITACKILDVFEPVREDYRSI
ncbi:MAG: quercetin dioxygenase-like cupin family protein [Mariniblastus sp.]|jgi:quercetin dioxygenase-like cupin family protein